MAILKTSQHFISIYVNKIWSLDDNINFAKLRFLTICWHFFTTNHKVSRYPLTAIFEIGGHIRIIWSLKQYLQDDFFLPTCTNISFIKTKHYFWAVCSHFTAQWHYMIGDGGHLGYWQPYWKDLNIFSVFMTLFEHLLCLKHKSIFMIIFLNHLLPV